MTDLNDSADLERLLRRFYERVLIDPIIGFYFTDVVDFDLEAHLPRIRAFWEQQLFGSIGAYRGRAFEAHLQLHRHTAITADHFHRWLYLFKLCVDELFAGPGAEAIKRRAERIATSMQEGLARFDREGASAPGVNLFEP